MIKSIPKIFFAVSMLCLLFHSETANARKGSRDISPGGEFSFRLESRGATLPTFYHRGYTYVEGRRSQRYSIRVFNHTNKRVESVVTVDGRDVITGREGNYRNQRGYVIQPYSSVLIDGFRTSWNGVAAFRFTDIEDSYAARMGNDSNVGVIGVAVFKEKRRRLARPTRPKHKRRSLGTRYGSSSKSAPTVRDGANRIMESDDCEEAGRGIGTGYGEDVHSPVTETKFARRSRRPNARLAIYYDDRRGLIARGVIRKPKPRHRHPHPEPTPFPQSYDQGFAPPPPSYRWE